MRKVIVETSWDDCTREDLIVADLLKKYRLPGIFFVPTESISRERPRLSTGGIRQLAQDFTLGGHTTTHPEDLKQLSLEEQRREIGENRRWLQKVSGQLVEVFCYPSGRYSPEATIPLVKEAGYRMARTTLVGSIDFSASPYRWPTTVQAANARKEYDGKPWTEYLRNMVETAREMGGRIHLWGHAWEVVERNQLRALEEAFKLLASL